MDIYQRKSRWKWYLAAAGAAIVLISMFYTKYLTDKLQEEEEKKVQQLKVAYETMNDTMQVAVTFQNNFFIENTTVTILLVDEIGNPQMGINFGEENDTTLSFLKEKLKEFQNEKVEPITIATPYGKQHLYFEHSLILRLLKLYPILQLILIAAFIAFGYLGFSTSRRAEQNRVWAGMAQDTAHQLGTPVSGIVAWIEHLRALREDDQEVNEVLDELGNDVVRLELIADRFSKIGSAPELSPVNIFEELEKCRAYMQRRASRKVEFHFPDPTLSEPIIVSINSHHFEWVGELTHQECFENA